MKETISVTVLVEIEYHAAARDDACDHAMECLTRDRLGDIWGSSYNLRASTTSSTRSVHAVHMLRSRAIQARKTKQRIMPRKER